MITKVCGLSHPGCIEGIAALRPSMMGFIFYSRSPRDAHGLPTSCVKSLPAGIERVGVFVDTPVETILQTADRYGLSAIQLHGKENTGDCSRLRDSGLKVMKAFGIGSGVNWEGLRIYEDSVDMFVLDTLTSKYGGSGRKFDWDILKDYPLATPFLLSGGISPEDGDAVRNAAKTLPHMAGVDINSRFETAPGNKDVDAVAKFLKLI